MYRHRSCNCALAKPHILLLRLGNIPGGRAIIKPIPVPQGTRRPGWGFSICIFVMIWEGQNRASKFELSKEECLDFDRLKRTMLPLARKCWWRSSLKLILASMQRLWHFLQWEYLYSLWATERACNTTQYWQGIAISLVTTTKTYCKICCSYRLRGFTMLSTGVKCSYFGQVCWDVGFYRIWTFLVLSWALFWGDYRSGVPIYRHCLIGL